MYDLVVGTVFQHVSGAKKEERNAILRQCVDEGVRLYLQRLQTDLMKNGLFSTY